MAEVTNKLAMKYTIPAHKRPEAGFRTLAIIPKVFGAIWKHLRNLPNKSSCQTPSLLSTG